MEIAKRLILFFLFVLSAMIARAEMPDSTGIVRHTHLFGLGATNILDTYLSPLEYTGGSFVTLHSTERRLPWRRGHWAIMGMYGGDFSYTKSPTDDSKYLDGNARVAFALHNNWRIAPHLRLAAGPLAEISGGFTYNTRNGNNPAQGRFALLLAASGQAEYDFRVKRAVWTARAQLDIPVIGMMFSPNYGQSYYEIFSLGNYDHNICATTPFNAPSARLSALLEIPVRKSRLTLGYKGNIRQSDANHLKRHFWGHYFVIGWSRKLKIIK